MGAFFILFTMKLHIAIFLFSCWLSTLSALACNCDGTLPPISFEQTESYDVIVVGKVDSVKSATNNQNVVFLSGHSLYKGLVTNQFQVFFANKTSCLIPFLEQEYWLIYAHKDSTDNSKLLVDYCGRTRKWVKSNANDEYIITSGITYMEELSFLEKNYPKSDFFTSDQLDNIQTNNKIVITADRRLEQATSSQKVLFIIISIVVFAFIYILVRKMK